MGTFCSTDLATNLTYELQGPDLDDLVGASVEVTGSTYETPAAPGASKVMSVSDIHQMPLSEIRGETPATPAPGAPAGNTPPTAPPTPSGDTPRRMVRARRWAPLRKLPPRPSRQPLLLLPLCPNTAIPPRSLSLWVSQPEPLLELPWAWVAVNRRPSARINR